MTVELTEEQVQRANELGWDRGWSHANYVEAYGSEGVSKIDYPADMDLDVIADAWRNSRITSDERLQRLEMRKLFEVAFKEGKRRFRRGLNVDGSPREND